MEYTTKQKIQLISIIMLYIVLGAVGVYSATLVFLFPILAAPLTLYLLRYKLKAKRSLLIHLIIILGITLFTGNFYEALLYLIVVAAPSHMVEFFYKSHTPIPYIVMYVGIGVIGLFYIYILGMQYMGIDYVEIYLAALDEYKMIQFQLLDELARAMPELQAESSIVTFKEIVNAQIIILKTIYPAMFLLIGVFMAMIQIIIVTIVGRIRKWHMQSLKQMGQFTFSKKMGMLLIVAILLSQLTIGDNEGILMLGVNLFFFLSSLLEVLGMIVFIVLIKRKKWSIGLKVVSATAIVMLMTTFPTAFMVVGLGDTLFNFRHAKIIV